MPGCPPGSSSRSFPCLDDPGTIHLTDPDPELIATLERERAQMDARIRCLTRNLDAIDSYLDAARRPPTAPA